jgi:hypothetical protein
MLKLKGHTFIKGVKSWKRICFQCVFINMLLLQKPCYNYILFSRFVQYFENAGII